MQGWVVTLITVAVSAIITTIISTIIGRSLKQHFEKHDADAKVLQEEEENKRRENIVKVLREEIEPISNTITKLGDKIDKIGEGTLCSLRNDILTCYYKCQEKGYRNDYDFQNIHDLDEAYTALDGNSFVADVMDRFDNLPTKEEFKEDIAEIKKRSVKGVSKKSKEKD